jgi:formylglycine-generating enzyme required for sulfatase activity
LELWGAEDESGCGCESEGYVVGFFNGINTTIDGAGLGLVAVRALMQEKNIVTAGAPDTKNDEPVHYDLFYNNTYGFWKDIAEVYTQKSHEIDSSGKLENEMTLLWEFIDEVEATRSEYTLLSKFVSPLADLSRQIADSCSKLLANVMKDKMEYPENLAADYKKHNAKMDEYATQHMKFLLIAHSQGNLFVNQAYDYILPQMSSSSVKVIHVAPATATVRGAYVLFNFDIVISTLRNMIADVTAPNVKFEDYYPGQVRVANDPLGHGFTEEYLAPTWSVIYEIDPNTAYSVENFGYTKITDNIRDAMNALIAPPCDDMVYVEGSSFTMGCTPEQGDDCDMDEYPAHLVDVNSFYIGRCEVTQSQWVAVMGSNPVLNLLEYYSRDEIPLGDNKPVTYMEWAEISEFIAKMNTLNPGKNYRLPTEAEWEFAARGGVKSKGYKYSGGDELQKVAWIGSDFVEGFKGGENYLYPVGTKAPNELGIYDMSGNVAEWTGSLYVAYPGGSIYQNVGDNDVIYYVIRGGDFINNFDGWRVSDRQLFSHSWSRSSGLGFRLVRIAPIQ